MERKIIDNETGISYTKKGDYYIPDLFLNDNKKIILNKYGRAGLKFLKESKKVEYTIMLMDGTLTKHLKEIQDEAEQKINFIVEQLKNKNNLTEEMKNTDQLKWIRINE